MPQERPRIPSEVEREVFVEAGHRCAVCGEPFPLERAHIVPWSRSKDHSAENLICLCASCHERADREKWGVALLREYKHKPWVNRRRSETPKDAPRQKWLIEVILRTSHADFDEKHREWLRFALAAFCRVSPHDVQIERLLEGSVKALVKLPREGAELLRTRRDDPELRAYLSPLLELIDLRVQSPTRERLREVEPMPRKLRLSQILKKHKERSGSISRLAEAISKANDGQRTVAERMLTEIIRGEPIMLRVSDLEAINVYLTPFGEGLADIPIFDADTVLRALVEKGEVVCFLPTRAREGENREYMSVWDVRGFSSIVEAINHRWPATRITLRDDDARPSVAWAPGDRDWAKLFEKDNASYCCIGAPLVFGLSEYMLAEMFGVSPFRKPTALDPRLPSYFVRLPHPSRESAGEEVESCVGFSADDLARMEAPGGLSLPDKTLPEAINQGRAQAFIAGNKLYPVRLDGEEWNDYGVVVAQRRPSGEIWAVVGGLSGPGTWAAAKLLGEIPLALPESELGEASRPVYAVVECAVRKDPKKAFGDPRELVNQRILLGPEVWEG